MSSRATELLVQVHILHSSYVKASRNRLIVIVSVSLSDFCTPVAACSQLRLCNLGASIRAGLSPALCPGQHIFRHTVFAYILLVVFHLSSVYINESMFTYLLISIGCACSTTPSFTTYIVSLFALLCNPSNFKVISNDTIR